MKKVYLIASALLALSTVVSAQEANDNTLVINEIMQSNIDCIMDDLKEFPDSWVEIYNTGSKAVNLKDYRLGTDNKADKAWQLPDKMVPPHGYMLVYCDKAADNTDNRLHTDFRLESGKGCAVYLFKGEDIADCLPETLKKQPAPNIAYGRKTDGADEWGYLLTPTPNKSNCGEICKRDNILGEPVFSEKGYVTREAINLKLELSLPDGCPEGTEIRYTTNGQEPTEESNLYESPISISKSTVVLAKLFCKGWLSPRATAQSYISHGRAFSIPVISIAIDDKYLNDKTIGIYPNNDGNIKKKDWRRPMNIEFFFKANTASGINQLCETRIAGGATRGAPLKTLAIYANKRFGVKRFDYEFFPKYRPGITDFKSLMLRNAGNDFDYLYMRDAVIQISAAKHLDLDWQAYRPAIVYINGVYRGMLNIRERSNEDNIYTNYDGLEDIDMFENWTELKEGTWDNYNAFKEFYNEKGHTLAEYDKWMDVDEFINLMIVNLYHNNLDFPGNNIVMWRPRAEGGRWRWIMKDTDFGLGLYDRAVDYKIFEWINNHNYDNSNNWANDWEHTRLFRRLMEDNDFFTRFTDRCLIYTGDFLNNKGIREVWDPMYRVIKNEYPYHRKLFNEWWPNYNDELGKAQRWLEKRTDLFITQMCNYYNLDNPIKMTINENVEDIENAGIMFNGVKLSKGTFNGKYLAGRTIHLEGDAKSGTTINGWTVRKTVSSNTTEETIEGSVLEMEMPKCSNLAIKAIFSNDAGISDIRQDRKPCDIYDINGRKIRTGSTSLDGLPKGIYIIGGNKVIK